MLPEHLLLAQIAVKEAAIQQTVMRSLIHYDAFLNHHYPIGIHDCGEAVSND
jgi:hypothetical protein